MERLKQYDGTGLTPEEIVKMGMAYEDNKRYSGRLDGRLKAYEEPRLRELSEADKEGRVVVLPCKVGDTVYKVITIQAQKPVMLETQVKTLGQAADVAQLIGKENKIINIFLTREEAEEALRRAKNG